MHARPLPSAFSKLPHPGSSGSAAPSRRLWLLETGIGGSRLLYNAQRPPNCPIGAFTHGVALSPEHGQELQTLIGTMVELKYLRPTRCPLFPHRTDALEIAAYAPLDQAPFEPDVVIFRGNVRQIMLLFEAARAAGIFDTGLVMGRPACAMLPHAFAGGTAVASVGCIGNRVYTGLGDNELYLTVPFAGLTPTLEHLRTTLAANAELEKFHKQKGGFAVGLIVPVLGQLPHIPRR